MLRRAALAGVAALALGACNMAPDYAVPQTPAAPVAFKETGIWTPAAPADTAARGHWWQVVDDPRLDALELRLDAESPRLAAAVARYDQARALAGRARADLFPQIGAGADATRARTISNVSGDFYDYHRYNVGAAASYEADVWGRVRNQVTARGAEAEASAADLAAMRLGLQADLAVNYFRLRGLDAEIRLLEESIENFARALELTQTRFEGGIASELDVGRAGTQLHSARSELEQRQADRALLEHAIAALVGEHPSRFAIAPVAELAAPPSVPVEAPATLLQRRPDVAAAERRVAAANAGIGAARAAFFPAITLNASGGSASNAGDLLSAGTGVWALGPASALLAVFDGGRRKADVDRARAEFEEAAAQYRQTALNAFSDVEDQLTLVNRLAEASDRQAEAIKAAESTNLLADIQYREGAIDYLSVVTAQTAELQARRVGIALTARRLAASVDLVRALGGPWRDGVIEAQADPSAMGEPGATAGL